MKTYLEILSSFRVKFNLDAWYSYVKIWGRWLRCFEKEKGSNYSVEEPNFMGIKNNANDDNDDNEEKDFDQNTRNIIKNC